MQTVIIIPARYESSRLPGKPLIEIAGHSLIKRVWSIANAVGKVDKVLIATDDQRIFDHGHSFGAEVVMTSTACRNGTERVYDVVRHMDTPPEIVVNLQGDAVLTPPWIVQAVVDNMKNDPDIKLGTPAAQLNWDMYERLVEQKNKGTAGGTLVTFDKNLRALYFSKNMIPHLRKEDRSTLPPIWLHIGLYGYRYRTLEKYAEWEPSPLEKAEQLEQLRAMENGLPITIVPVDYRNRTAWSIDNPEDVVTVEKIIAREGELVPLK